MTDIDHQRALVSVRAVVREQGKVSVFARSQRLVAASVLSFDREESAATGVEHLLTALASDVVGGLARLARRRRVVLDGLEATLQAEVDGALTWLGVVGEAGAPTLRRIEGTVYVSSGAKPDELEALWREVLAMAPVHGALARSVDVQLSLKPTA